LGRRGIQPFLVDAVPGRVQRQPVQNCRVAARGPHGDQRCRGRFPLAVVGAIFILPFVLFSGYAGQLADVYSKRTVLVVTKALEIVATALGLLAFTIDRLEITYVVLFLFALQATFFSPAKYGILPKFSPTRSCRAPTACSR
jgi:MFS family permease